MSSGLVRIVLLLSGVLVCALSRSEGQVAPGAAVGNDIPLQSASACIGCHSTPGGQDFTNKSTDFVLLTEYPIWRTYDKHAQAYAVLLGPRGDLIAENLGKGLDRKVKLTDAATGCLGCHAPDASAPSAKPEDIDGVSCTGCHGSNRGWVEEHYKDLRKDAAPWRSRDPEYKAGKGLIDLRDPEKKASLCLSCHIGNAAEGKVVTHAMFAAGHPPLPPIEVATFTENMPKHWRDADKVPFLQTVGEEVKKHYHVQPDRFQRTRLALMGGVVALRATLKMAVARADFKAGRSPRQLWPELHQDHPTATDVELRSLASAHWPEIAMAHSDCYGCHHDLTGTGFRQRRGFGYHLPGEAVFGTTPGRPTIRDWPLALLKPALQIAQKPAELTTLSESCRELARITSTVPFCEPAQLAAGTEPLDRWCKSMIANLADARLYTDDSVHKLLIELCGIYKNGNARQAANKSLQPLPDYETARMLSSLLLVAYHEWRQNSPADPAIEKSLQELSTELDVRPFVQRDLRLDLVLEVVQKAAGAEDKDAMRQFSSYVLNVDRISDEKVLRGLRANKFLFAVGAKGNEDYNKAFQQRPVVDVLQELSNNELKVQLGHLAAFKPEVFLQRLDGLAGSLVKE